MGVSVRFFEIGLMHMRMRMLSPTVMAVRMFVLDVPVVVGSVGV